MGLAASQARLLTITARLADNELRSQTINNAKMRLASQSTQVSDEYLDALNDSRLMFTNTSADGLAQTQILNFNNLMQYSQYNNQYGVVNAAGQLLVSEEDAKIFENCNNNLEKFLEEHDLEWSTTFFDDPNLKDKLTSFYASRATGLEGDINGALSNYFSSIDSNTLKDMYMYSTTQEASIEKMNYDVYAKNLYEEYLRLYDNTIPEFRKDILGDSDAAAKEQEIIAMFGEKGAEGETLGIDNAEWAKDNLLKGTGNPAGTETYNGTDSAYALLNVQQYLTNDALAYIYQWILGFCDEIYPGSGKTASFVTGAEDISAPTSSSNDYTLEIPGTPTAYDSSGNPTEYQYQYTKADGTLVNSTGSTPTTTIPNAINALGLSPENGTMYTFRDVEIHINDWMQINTPATGVSDFQLTNYLTVHGQDFYFDNTRYTQETQVPFSAPDFSTMSEEEQRKWVMDLLERVKVVKEEKEIIEGIETNIEYLEAYQVSKGYDPATGEYKTYDTMWISEIHDPAIEPQYTREEMYKMFASEYLKMILDTQGFFDPEKYADTNEGAPALENYIKAKNLFKREYGFIPTDITCLIDFDKMFATNAWEIGGVDKSTDAFNNIVALYALDKALDVLGEPKFAWVDKSDTSNTGNADAKAQWLTNIFNRMQYGYKVLENGLAKSADWLEYAFESGLVSMEQVDRSFNWIGLDYKSCANIFEETDNSTSVAKAEAKYNRAMNDIKQKDSMYDLQLKNIDTEHNALQTEYDVIKQVINKNIERTMKFNQSA